MIEVQRRPALHSWLGSGRPAPRYMMRANQDNLSCPLLTLLTLANIPSSRAGPAPGNPSESPGVRSLALPMLPSLLPSFIFSPPPCPVSRVILSHPRGLRVIPTLLHTHHGSPPAACLFPVDLHIFGTQPGATSHVLSFQGDGRGPPGDPVQGTDLCLHGYPLVWNRSLVEGSVPSTQGVLEAEGSFHFLFPASSTVPGT